MSKTNSLTSVILSLNGRILQYQFCKAGMDKLLYNYFDENLERQIRHKNVVFQSARTFAEPEVSFRLLVFQSGTIRKSVSEEMTDEFATVVQNKTTFFKAPLRNFKIECTLFF